MDAKNLTPEQPERTRHVFVVMGNDFPDAVFSSEMAAEEHCRLKREQNAKEGLAQGRIYWRVYRFALQVAP